MKNASGYTGYWLGLLMITGLSACYPVVPTATPTAKPDNNAAHQSAAIALTPEEKNALAGLQWLNNANAEQAAAAELNEASEQSRKPQLLAFAGRGLSYPGLNKEQFAAIANKVTYKVAEGSGDIVYNSVHRALQKKLRAYSTAYNKAIFSAVQ